MQQGAGLPCESDAAELAQPPMLAAASSESAGLSNVGSSSLREPATARWSGLSRDTGFEATLSSPRGVFLYQSK